MYGSYKNAKKHSDLQNFVEKADINELCDMVTSNICYPKGKEILDNVLEGFSKKDSYQSQKYTLIEAVLKSLLKAKVTTNHVDSIVNRIVNEFPNFQKKLLLKLVDFCLSSIKNNDDDFMSWKDILPFLLQTLREEKFINYRGNEMSGTEFKSHIVKIICDDYDPKLSTSLAKMFREMSLEKNDLEIAMKALCHTIATTEVSEIPPLVHQLLRLGNDSRILFNTLQRYFSQKYEEVSQENSEDCDTIGVICLKDVQDSESTVLYHIYQAVQMDHKILKDYFRFLKSITNTPDFILDPFTISVLLFNMNLFKDQVFDVLKSVVVRKCQDEKRCKNSIWFSKLVNNDWRVIDVLSDVIKNSVSDRQTIIENLLQFAFFLMGMEKRISHEETVLWEVGEKIVQRIAKKVSISCSIILQYLSEKIISNENSFLQYIGCLSYMCRKLTSVVLDNESLIILLLERLLSKLEHDFMPVVSAILPLLKLSQRVRDTFVLVLRKALTKSSIHLRKMSILGFLELLKNLKISSLNALSQRNNCSLSSSTSSYSIVTQATLERNEHKLPQDPKYNISLCLEVLSILKRCFMYDCQVRLYLYHGIYDVVAANMELAEYVTEMLLDHFMLFYESDEDVKPPIIFDKCTITQGAEEVLREPLGDLIFLIQKLYIKTALKNYAALNKFSMILESLSKRMSLTEAEHLNLNETTDLLENTPKSQKLLHTVKLTISICESLIAYRFGCWSIDSVNFAQIVNNLFKAYLRFTDFLKRSNKVKKGDLKKGDKDVTDKSMMRKGNRAATLKLPNTVMDVYTVNRMLLLLYETNLTWVSKEEADILRNRVEFHNYVLQTCLQLIRNAKSLKGDISKKHKDQNSKTYIQIGRLLFKNVISKLGEVENLTPISSSYAVECFKELCDLMCDSWASELPFFLNAAGGVDVKKVINAQIESVLTPLQTQFRVLLQAEDDDELMAKKMPLHLLETISYLVYKMIFDQSGQIDNIREWLKTQAATKIEEPPICLAIIQLLLFVDIKMTERGEILHYICDDLYHKSCEVPDSDSGDYEIINEKTLVQIFGAANNSIKSQLNDVIALLSRLKAKQTLIIAPGMKNDKERTKIKNLELSLCTQLANITTLLNTLVQCKIGAGSHTDALLKNVQQTFNTMSNLTKHFSSKVTPKNKTPYESTRFVSLVERAGTDLKPNVEAFTWYIEKFKKTQSKSSETRNKILKEIKIIPRVTYEMEQFNKEILGLSKKSEVDLNKRIKHSTTRDFRIDNEKLDADLERIDSSVLTTQNTTHNATRADVESSVCDESEETENEIPSKKRKMNSSSESD